MATPLRFQNVAGLRVRQQSLREGKLKNSEMEWRFEPTDVEPEINERTHEPTGWYQVYVCGGSRNLVLDRKGPATDINFRNASVRNQLRVIEFVGTDTARKDRTGAPIKEWAPRTTSYIAANAWAGVRVGEGLRAVIDEMPT